MGKPVGSDQEPGATLDHRDGYRAVVFVWASVIVQPLRSPLNRKLLGDLLSDESEPRVNSEAPVAAAVGLTVLLVLACTGSPSKGQWILESYDKDAGYTFVHDGVVYKASCVATGRPMLPGDKPDLDPRALPPNTASHQSECDDILPYLHQPVPSLTRPYPSILLFVGRGNQRLEFEIENAK